MKRIWDSALWTRLHLEGAAQINEEFKNDPNNRAHLGAQLLLYDTVVIPTKDFGIVPTLAAWCGVDCLVGLLRKQAVEFVWHQTHPCYGGNGGGISSMSIDEPATGWENWRQVTRWAPMEEAAQAQVENSFPSLNAKERANLCSLVLKNASAASSVSVRDETYRDIANNEELTRFVMSHEPPGTADVAPNRLSGIKPNQVRVPGKELCDGIDLTLRIAEINTEIALAASLDDCDFGTSPGANVLLAEKMKRIGATPSQLDNFMSVLELERLPDIRPAIVAREVTLERVVKIRGTRSAKRFRRWLHATRACDPRELERCYVQAIGKMNASWPLRALRAIVVTGVGFVDPSGGFAVAAGDSVFVDRWLGGYNPKLFFENLRALPLRETRGQEG